MKRICVLIIALCSLFSCSKEYDGQPDESESGLRTKAFFSLEELMAEDVIVREPHIQKYILFKEADRNNQENRFLYLEPFKINDEPVYYAIQYEKGWEIISADMRGPIVLAHSSDGTYKEALLNETIAEWFSSIAEDIESRRNDKNHYKDISYDILEKESSSLEFWKLVTGDSKYLEKYSINTKIPVEPIEYDGYWQLTGQHQHEVVYAYIPHLIQTKWHQQAPFNFFCPYRTDYSSLKAPAGCVAIAGAQMLYYLHYFFGRPVTAPISANCTGTIDNYYVSFTGDSSTIWDSMLTDNYDETRYYDTSYSDDCSALIAQVGNQINMNYGNGASSAYTEDLVNNVFVPRGISCNYVNYNTSKLFASLQNNKPVIARASSSASGHAFIIDGYKSLATAYYADYQWMKYLGNGEYEPEARYLHEVTYSTPTLEEIYMNWGWGGDYDDTVYSPSAIWTAGNEDYTSNKKMIYNFAVIQ